MPPLPEYDAKKRLVVIGLKDTTVKILQRAAFTKIPVELKGWYRFLGMVTDPYTAGKYARPIDFKHFDAFINSVS